MFDKLLTLIKIHMKLFVTMFIGSGVLFALVWTLWPHVYEAKASIYMSKRIPDAPTEFNLPDFMGPNLSDHIEIMHSDAVLAEVVKDINADKHFSRQEKLSVKELSKRLRIQNPRATKTIHLKYQFESSGNPKTYKTDRAYAIRVLDLVLNKYDNHLRQLALNTKKNMESSLGKELHEKSALRQTKEKRLAELQSESGTTDIDTKNAELLKVRSAYMETYGSVNAQKAAAAQELAHIQKTLQLTPEQIKGLSRVAEDPKIKSWQAELSKHQGELVELRSVYTDKYPVISEKQRTIGRLEDLVKNRIKDINGSTLGASVDASQYLTTNLDQNLSEKLLELQADIIGFNGQKSYYDSAFHQMKNEFSLLAEQRREIEQLKFDIDNLKKEEQAIQNKQNTQNLEQEIIAALGTFSKTLAPTAPASSGDYIFPLKAQQSVTGGLIASLFLSLFTVSLVELFRPRLISLDTLPVLAEVTEYSRAVNERELKNVYQNMALLINKYELQKVTLFHMCGANLVDFQGDPKKFDTPYLQCPYSPGVFSRQLAAMFAERGIKTLLVDCSDTFSDDEGAREVLAKLVDHTLYTYSGIENLHILSPTTGATFFDPYYLKLLPEHDSYDLIFLNASLSENDMLDNVFCSISDATIVGISQTKTPASSLRNFQRISQETGINLLGSILFP